MIRDWTDSESVDSLSPHAEVFFTRLIMKADDFGNYTGNPKLINAALFPFKCYDVMKVYDWIEECEKAGLVLCYSVDGKQYLHINNYDQKLRRMRAVYPPPPDGQARTVDGNLRTNDGQVTAEVEEEEKKEVETEVEHEDARVTLWPTFDDFWTKYAKKVDRLKCEKIWKKISQEAREKIMEHLERYVRSTPEIQFRKDPATYLRNKSWENEIIPKANEHPAKITVDQRNALIRAGVA